MSSPPARTRRDNSRSSGRAPSLATRPAPIGRLSQLRATTNCAKRCPEELGDQCYPRRGGQVFQQPASIPGSRARMAVTLDDTGPHEKRHQLGIKHFSISFQRPPRAKPTSAIGGRRPRPAGRLMRAGDGALHFAIAGRDDLDEIGVDQEPMNVRGSGKREPRGWSIEQRPDDGRAGCLGACARTLRPWA